MKKFSVGDKVRIIKSYIRYAPYPIRKDNYLTVDNIAKDDYGIVYICKHKSGESILSSGKSLEKIKRGNRYYE